MTTPLRHPGPWLACALATTALAAAPFTAQDRQPTPAELAELPAVDPAKATALRKTVEAPDDFEVSIFATPPAVNYPVFVAASPDGTLYVSSDGNGSLDRKPHLGRVLRVRDTNADGQADEVKAFVPDVDSPRGLVWDHDRLYLLHPPDLSVFVDRDGDGVADEKKTLVSGIGWTFKDRPADHGSNGLELGIDGWLYAAIGDFGFREATGADGRKLQLRGGGVVRVRTDGSGLELWADGTRNIVEAAVSPLLDGFARDNTNDGGGWDVRLHHFSGLTQHGYPRLFKNFTNEIIQPLADFGGGSGCGAAWIDEPGVPKRWNHALFTADWGREWVYHHELRPRGGTFTTDQNEFVKVPRVTDLDVDGHGAIYIASWKGASFTWVGPEVGFLVKLTPRNTTPEPWPELTKLPEGDVLKLLESGSHRRRLAAQREILRRGVGCATGATLTAMAADRKLPAATRVACLFTLKQGLGEQATDALARLAGDETVAPWALRALTDHEQQLSRVPAPVLLAALDSPDARTRKEATIALARLGRQETAPPLAAHLGDPDPVVAHTTVQALIRLRANEACLALLDDPQSAIQVRHGALRVLQSLPETGVVEELITRLNRETRPDRRAGLFTTLCRLHFREGEWKGDSWGTRPDTRGPFYQPETWGESARIKDTLLAVLRRASPAEAALLGAELARHRVPMGEAINDLIARASSDPALGPTLAAQLAEAVQLPPAAIPPLVRAANADDTPDAARAQAVIALAKSDSPEAWRGVLTALPRVQATKTENNLAEKARQAVANPPHLDALQPILAETAARLDGDPSLMADGLLLKLASRQVGNPSARAAATRSLDEAWAEPRRRVQILRAAARFGDTARAAQFVAALQDPDSRVVEAAQEAIRRLKIDPDQVRSAAQTPRIGDLKVPDVLAQVEALRGDVVRGEQLFNQIGCSGCHTVRAGEPLKGPYLGTIANTYRRPQLAEAILLPNKTLAQGFVTQHFTLKNGDELDGFVVEEAAEAVTVRTVTAEEKRLPIGEIAQRERREQSLMPEGLAAGLTMAEFAGLLDYLESLAKTSK